MDAFATVLKLMSELPKREISAIDRGHTNRFSQLPFQPPSIQPIYYGGIIPKVESDEYADMTNLSDAPVNLKGWRLNAGDPG